MFLGSFCLYITYPMSQVSQLYSLLWCVECSSYECPHMLPISSFCHCLSLHMSPASLPLSPFVFFPFPPYLYILVAYPTTSLSSVQLVISLCYLKFVGLTCVFGVQVLAEAPCTCLACLVSPLTDMLHSFTYEIEVCVFLCSTTNA